MHQAGQRDERDARRVVRTPWLHLALQVRRQLLAQEQVLGRQRYCECSASDVNRPRSISVGSGGSSSGGSRSMTAMPFTQEMGSPGPPAGSGETSIFSPAALRAQ